MQGKIRLVVFGCLWMVQALYAVTYHIAMPVAGGDDDNAGLDWSLPKASISNALAQGNVTVILVSNGTYTLAAAITNNKAVVIRSWHNGAVDPENTIIDGGSQHCCFVVTHADAVLDGLTITRGFRTSDTGYIRGGGVYMSAGLATNCLILSNTAQANVDGYGGGGVCLDNGGALWNCRLAGNIVTNPPAMSSISQAGGGVLIVSSGMVVNCEFADNQCYSVLRGGGGAALFRGGYLDNCTFFSNYTDNRGGGVCAQESGVISNCRMTSNTGGKGGGGLYILNGKANAAIGVSATDCLVSNNIATGKGSGGGIFVYLGTNHVVRNCTLVNNIAGQDGGGLYASSAGLLMEDCLVAHNQCHGLNSGGGGIAALAPATNMILIRNVVVKDNKASASEAWGGGGVHLGNAWLENSIIENNYATNCGGGGVFAGKTSTVVNCQIVSNQSGYRGGGILAKNFSVIRNCLVMGNMAEGLFGGGIYAENNSAGEISCCTVVDNETQGGASQRGAGICVTHANRIYNCLVWSNRWSGTAADQERDLGMYPWGDLEAQSNSVYYCCSPRNFNGVSGNITNPPSFVGITDGNWRLTAGSAGINAGTNQSWMLAADAVDLDGRPRLDRFSHLADMGCYEYVAAGTLFRLK